MYCLLNYLFFILSLLDNTDWLAKFKRYRVYVSQENQHAMPENTLGYYRPGTGRWGVHIIRVKANLPKNLKITVLCHQMAHFIEYVNNKSKHKKDLHAFLLYEFDSSSFVYRSTSCQISPFIFCTVIVFFSVLFFCFSFFCLSVPFLTFWQIFPCTRSA